MGFLSLTGLGIFGPDGLRAICIFIAVPAFSHDDSTRSREPNSESSKMFSVRRISEGNLGKYGNSLIQDENITPFVAKIPVCEHG